MYFYAVSLTDPPNHFPIDMLCEAAERAREREWEGEKVGVSQNKQEKGGDRDQLSVERTEEGRGES